MKIGIPTFGSDGGKSGISRYLISLLGEFARIDGPDEYELITYPDEKHLFDPGSPKVQLTCLSTTLRSPARNILWHQTVLPRLCRRRGWDVLFLPAGNRRLPLRCPCPSVGTVHDLAAIHVDHKYDPARMFYVRRVLPRLIRSLTRVITVSQSSKQDIVSWTGVSNDRVEVIPLAADPTMFFPRDPRPSADRVAAKFGIHKPFILYLSRLEHPGKNHLTLIRAFDRLKQDSDIPHQLVLAGSDWTRAQKIHLAAEQQASRQDIIFTGFVPDSDVPDLYCASDLFVFPSLFEGFGLPVLEAMRCGIPVACSNVSSIPEVAGDAARLFDPHNTDDIADAMREMLTDEPLRQRCVQRGLTRSKAFTWDLTARRTMQVLHAAAKE